MEESGGTPAHASLNPCVMVQEAVKAMLRCLGLETAEDHPAFRSLKPQDFSPASTMQATDPPSSTATELDPIGPAEADDPPTGGEMEGNQATLVASAVTVPPIKTGTGPQIN